MFFVVVAGCNIGIYCCGMIYVNISTSVVVAKCNIGLCVVMEWYMFCLDNTSVRCCIVLYLSLLSFMLRYSFPFVSFNHILIILSLDSHVLCLGFEQLALLWLWLDAVLVCMLSWYKMCLIWASLALLLLVLNTVLVCVLL